VLSGCATAGKVKLQTVRVRVADEKGAEKGADLGAARCTPRNGAADWQISAPGVATVSVDAEPLPIACASEDGQQASDASLERKRAPGRNMLIGAGVGLAVGGAIGASTSRKDCKRGDVGTQLTAGLGLAAGLLCGLIVGTGAGAASGDAGSADAVRVTLKPVPPPATP
jgi:hypothetical protein